MQCEICGEDIRGSPEKVIIDGSELLVCIKCSTYGKSVSKRSPVSRKILPTQPSTVIRSNKTKKTGFEKLSDEIVDNYDELIKEAREKQGLTPEQLASQIKEKVALIRKFERKELVPEDAVRSKLERALGIKLVEKIKDDDWQVDHLYKGTTLGDIVKIKRK